MTGTSPVALKTFKHNGGWPRKGLQIGVITVLGSLADRFAQARICAAIIGNTHGNAPFGFITQQRNLRYFLAVARTGTLWPTRPLCWISWTAKRRRMAGGSALGYCRSGQCVIAAARCAGGSRHAAHEARSRSIRASTTGSRSYIAPPNPRGRERYCARLLDLFNRALAPLRRLEASALDASQARWLHQ
jgi:hypothetical protein